MDSSIISSFIYQYQQNEVEVIMQTFSQEWFVMLTILYLLINLYLDDKFQVLLE